MSFRHISTGFAAVAPVLALAMGLGGPAFAQSAETEEIVKTMRGLAGNQKARPSGAKGQCVIGTFTPTAEARALTKSAAFSKPSRVVARFSVGGGNPKVPDATKTVNRGFSFKLDDGGAGQTEFVMVNAPVNFVSSPTQMLAFLKARVPGADGKPDAEKIKAFTDANPETTNQGKYLASKPVVGSWVGVNYWGIHPYTLTNAAGAKQVVKFRMAPAGGEVGLTDDEAKAKPADFLVGDLTARVTAKTANIDMLAIMARPGDEARKVTDTWVDEDKRPTVKLGTISFTAIEKNDTCDNAIFDPTNTADGLAGPVNDPLFMQRQPAYAISISQRL
jgi:catalase